MKIFVIVVISSASLLVLSGFIMLQLWHNDLCKYEGITPEELAVLPGRINEHNEELITVEIYKWRHASSPEEFAQQILIAGKTTNRDVQCLLARYIKDDLGVGGMDRIEYQYRVALKDYYPDKMPVWMARAIRGEKDVHASDESSLATKTVGNSP